MADPQPDIPGSRDLLLNFRTDRYIFGIGEAVHFAFCAQVDYAFGSKNCGKVGVVWPSAQSLTSFLSTV